MENKLGISTACYYPQTTEKSFEYTVNANFKYCELFMNSPSELSDKYINALREKQQENGINIISLHPFMSFAESFFLFSSYERRFFDIMPVYERFFEVMQILGAKYFIMHGAKIPGSVPEELHFERYKKLCEVAKKYNVTVCQENVVHYRSESIEYLSKMKNYLGDDFKLCLDIKQARRTFISPYDFINAFTDDIAHIHISDYSSTNDCIPPFEGLFDFNEFFTTLKEKNYGGAFIIELYDHSYSNPMQIVKSFEKTDFLLKNI